MKCEHCGAHIEETDKRCPYCNSYNEQYKKPQPPAQPQQRPQVNNTANKKPEEPQGAGCLSVILIFFIIGVCILVFVAFAKSCSNCTSTKKGSTDGGVSGYVDVVGSSNSNNTPTKIRPTISGEITLSGITFTIYANDNYDKVEFYYTVFDKDDKAIKTAKPIRYNYQKGVTYTEKVSLSPSELLAIKEVKYDIMDYE